MGKRSVKKLFNVRMRKLLGYTPFKRDFRDIETCPICTQDKPVDKYSIKEICHIQKHLRRTALQMIEVTAR